MASSLYRQPPTDQNGMVLTDSGKKILDSAIMLKNSGKDPSQIIEMAKGNNPNLANLINMHNGNYREVAMALAKEKGIVNPDEMMRLIKEYMSKS